jgi:hypothetical protein
MIRYYLLDKNQGVVKAITNDDGSTHHQVLVQESDNTDYQAYLKWLEEGNTPTSADEQIS